MTRRQRYEHTARQLRWILNYASYPRGLTGEYRAFDTFYDRFNGVWLRLIKHEKYIAILEKEIVRIRRDTVYSPILEAWAERTGRRVVYLKSIRPVGSMSPCDFWDDILPEAVREPRLPGGIVERAASSGTTLAIPSIDDAIWSRTSFGTMGVVESVNVLTTDDTESSVANRDDLPF